MNQFKLGWHRDLPDIRDYGVESKAYVACLKAINAPNGDAESSNGLPKDVDLSEYFPRVEDQGKIGSCTAHSAVGLMEYFENRVHGRHIDASRLFVYKTTRNLLQWTGDTGAYIRSAMQALVLFGAPPEKYWPYVESKYDLEPDSFAYSYGQRFATMKYVRLDPPGVTPKALLGQIKHNLNIGIPLMFGFTVFDSLYQSADGMIPFPTGGEQVQGGHAVIACGYDDDKVIAHPVRMAERTVGAIKIRNSWGESWGENGYGWIPYEYILRRVAVDWWGIIDQKWFDPSAFKMDV